MNTASNGHNCYGSMFPDFQRLRRKERSEGQAFAALVVGSGTGPDGRNLDVKSEAWKKCVQCSDYRTCYDLSVAKLLMNHVLMNTMWVNPWVGE